jgi:hypothetical protein
VLVFDTSSLILISFYSKSTVHCPLKSLIIMHLKNSSINPPMTEGEIFKIGNRIQTVFPRPFVEIKDDFALWTSPQGRMGRTSQLGRRANQELKGFSGLQGKDQKRIESTSWFILNPFKSGSEMRRRLCLYSKRSTFELILLLS